MYESRGGAGSSLAGRHWAAVYLHWRHCGTLHAVASDSIVVIVVLSVAVISWPMHATPSGYSITRQRAKGHNFGGYWNVDLHSRKYSHAHCDQCSTYARIQPRLALVLKLCDTPRFSVTLISITRVSAAGSRWKTRVGLL